MKLAILNPLGFIQELKDNQEPFKIVSTILTKTIITETNEYFFTSKTNLKPKELNLIKSVKDGLYETYLNDEGEKNKRLKSEFFKVNCDRSKIQYISKGLLKNGTYKKNLYEIDLKSAYWNFAYKNGFINKTIFDRGNDVTSISKKARLISLGNLAKRKTVIEFDGLNFSKAEFITSHETENLFFKVSSQTDAVMNICKLIAGNSYLFYWCDAIFLNSEKAKNDIEYYLTNEGHEFKTIEISKILKTRSYINVWDDTRPEPRPFIFEPLKVKDMSNLIY